jgi:HSP20 family protein
MPSDCTKWMRRLFAPPADIGAWRPLADVYRTPGGWLVKCELAGVRPDDLTLAVRGSCLILAGTRRDWCLEEGCSHYRLEISYSHFERTIELPENLERARVATEFRHGMLLVRIEREAP